MVHFQSLASSRCHRQREMHVSGASAQAVSLQRPSSGKVRMPWQYQLLIDAAQPQTSINVLHHIACHQRTGQTSNVEILQNNKLAKYLPLLRPQNVRPVCIGAEQTCPTELGWTVSMQVSTDIRSSCFAISASAADSAVVAVSVGKAHGRAGPHRMTSIPLPRCSNTCCTSAPGAPACHSY